MNLSNKTFNKSLLLTLILSAPASTAWAGSTESLEQRVKILESQLAQKSQVQSDDNISAKFYATVRPSLTWNDQGEDSSVDVTDFLSFAGVFTEADLGDGWTAIAQGEWGIDISDNGDFGKARRAYVGIDSPYGRVAFGKDRAVDYLLHATHVDIFNHRSSPYAYDNIGGFFTSNQVSYRNSWDTISFLAAIQSNGSADGVDYSDKSIAGLSYDDNGLHLAASFKTQKQAGQENTDTVAVSYAQQLTEAFYLAAVYQDEEEINTIDVSLAYKLNDDYKVKAGYYNFDDGINNVGSRSNDGINLTLERQFTPSFRTHIELLTKNFDNFEDETAVTVGFKYDLANLWKS